MENIRLKIIKESEERLNQDIKPSFPSFFEQIKNLASTLSDFAKDKFRLSDTELWQNRYEICKGCRQFSNNRCSKCGCYTKTKSKIKAAKCPLNKWHNENETLPEQQ